MKSDIDSLAIFGGTPAFAEKLHVGRPNIGNRQNLMARINAALDRKWLTNDGPFVQEFERCVAELLGVRHCVAMCNGTVALEIAVRATGLVGEVIIPSFSFVATAHALQWQEITPIFCDVDPRTHNIDPEQVEKLITPYTTGIIGVHLWGRPCDIEALVEIGRRHNLTVLFDAAQAFGSSYKGQMIGNFGSAEVFSFHATKFINTLEGGAVCTNDDVLAQKLSLMRNFGFENYDDVIHIGTNGKMNEIAAAMGLTSLESLSEFLSTNFSNHKLYHEMLDGIPGVHLLEYDESERCNFQYVVLEIDDAVTKVSRDQLQQILWAENVLARRYFYPGCHRMEPYRSYFPHAGLQVPNTEQLAQKILCLPTGTSIGPDEIKEISQIIRCVLEQGQPIRERLARSAEQKLYAT